MNSDNADKSHLRKRAKDDETVHQTKEQQLSALKQELKTARKNVSLLRAPITTLTVFTQVIYEWIKKMILYLFSHHIVLYSLLGCGVTLLGLIMIPGDHQVVRANEEEIPHKTKTFHL